MHLIHPITGQHENLYTPHCIRTVSGKYVNVFDPRPEMIDISDIAHALSNQCRFGGHLPKFYSVAQHSFRCCLRIKNWQHKLAALLHDAAEAYLIDVPSPVKAGLSNYKDIEHRLMEVIAEKYGFQYPLHEDVKQIDQEVLEIEWEGLMLGNQAYMDFICFSPRRAKSAFLETFKVLTI